MSDHIEIIAKAIHESNPDHTSWDDLPDSPGNPQRYYARRAAVAVLVTYLGPENMQIALNPKKKS